MSKYKIGSTVKVVRNGKSYTRYREFYERHKTNKCFDYVKYALADRGAMGVVMASGKHEHESSIVYLVNIESIHKCILIGEDGIELLSEPIATPITAPNWVMVIRPDSTNPDITIATLKLGKDTVRIESVKRHYKDAYDRDAAIKAVVEKMMAKPVSEVKEVKRQAVKGEWVKATADYDCLGQRRYSKGDILFCKDDILSEPSSIWHKKAVVYGPHSEVIRNENYVVLENYKPDLSDCSTGAVGETVCSEPVKELPKPIMIGGDILENGSKIILKKWDDITNNSGLSQCTWEIMQSHVLTVSQLSGKTFYGKYTDNHAFYFSISAIDRIIED